MSRGTANKDNPRAGSEIIDRVHVVAEQWTTTYLIALMRRKKTMGESLPLFFVCVSTIERSHHTKSTFLMPKPSACVYYQQTRYPKQASTGCFTLQ